MIKLATVFSGIGAVEHALDRMQIEHKIVFACDNGDVELEIPKISMDLDSIENEIEGLKIQTNNLAYSSKKKDNCEYADRLESMIDSIENQYIDLVNRLSFEDSKTLGNAIKDCAEIIDYALNKISKTKRKKYLELKEIYLKLTAKNSSRVFFILCLFHTLNDDQIVIDSANIKLVIDNQSNIKQIIKKGRDIVERLQMVHEEIFYQQTKNALRKLESYEARKKYVDDLYKGKESQNKVKQSYMANYKVDDKNFHWNAAFLDGNQYKGKVDLFVGGSPCQSFSLVGKQRGLEDTRGTLFYEYARLVKEIQPKVFIYENVKAILSNDDGKTWETMKDVFNSLNYKVYDTINGKPSVLNAKDYGIPQNRERVFVVGFRNDLKLSKEFVFPKPIKLERKMQDFLLDNVSGAYYLPKKGVDFVTSERNLTKRYTQIDGDIALCQKKNQQFNWHGDFIFVEENKDMEKTMEKLEKYFLSEKVEKYVMACGTKNFYSKPRTDLEIARPLLTTMHKMHRAGVDNYVHTEGRLRKLTPRECLRLMGFCDSFKIVVSDTAMYQQAGNSIVVDVLIALLNQIFDAYDFFDNKEETK